MDCYEMALAYAGERKQFGRPIASFQLVQQKLVYMVNEIRLPEKPPDGAPPRPPSKTLREWGERRRSALPSPREIASNTAA
jgi:Acyl-CoA dehydrogenase, C-terminal domain